MEKISNKILEIIESKLERGEEIRPKDLKRYAKTLVYLKSVLDKHEEEEVLTDD